MVGPAATPDKDALRRAAAALQRGALVVFPTETVYGLGAHAWDAAAVARLFAAKGRPADNPVIVHVAETEAARRLVSHWPAAAQKAADAFWPGPLTLVLPRADGVPDAVTAGLDSVAVRVPAHPLAQALLAASGLPIAAPSANISGRPSPTRVEDARADLGDVVAVYLDGGPTEIGLESTVLDLRGAPTLLRPGGVTRQQLESVLGPLAPPPEGEARAPGMRHRHYAPRATVQVLPPGHVEAQYDALRAQGRRVALVTSTPRADPHVRVPGTRANTAAWARAIFALLRDLDSEGYEVILVEEPTGDGLGEALADRLRRAAQGSAAASRGP